MKRKKIDEDEKQIRYLEVPKEIISHFEVGSNGEDFVNEILDADDTELA